jgi:EAL domain-containing protein (putative c-di-GMP-specific phosphodiesterase class I)
MAFAHRMGLVVGAKGEESRRVTENMRLHGCDHAQGYYFGYPFPANEMMRRLNESHTPASK